MSTVNELIRNRAELIVKVQSINENATSLNTENVATTRSLSPEEQTSFDAHWVDIESLDTQIETEQRNETRNARLSAILDAPVDNQPLDHRMTNVEGAQGAGDIYPVSYRSTEEYQRAMDDWIVTGDDRAIRDIESRALQVDNTTQAGVLTPSEQASNQLIQFVDDNLFIQGLATTERVPNADSLGIISLDVDVDDPEWTAELSIGTADDAMALGKRKLTPHPLARHILVSNTLLRKGTRTESLVTERLGYKILRVKENAIMNGDGNNKPLGLFTNSDKGISTSRNISTGNTSTAITFDGLVEAKYALKEQYWSDARWIFNRTVIKEIALLKDADGRNIWSPSVTLNEPDILYGFRVHSSELAPNTLTTGLNVGILGVYKHYWIADALNPTMQRLVELFALTNQTAFIIRLESDGMPALEEAFARVTLA